MRFLYKNKKKPKNQNEGCTNANRIKNKEMSFPEGCMNANRIKKIH